MRAMVHGHQRLLDAVDEGVELLLRDRGLWAKDHPIGRLGLEGQVDVLVLADRLDADLRPLIAHLTGIRNRMVHSYGVEFTKAEGATCLRLLPDRVTSRMSHALDSDRARARHQVGHRHHARTGRKSSHPRPRSQLARLADRGCFSHRVVR